MSKPIEDYALIGDGHTVALVARDGAIDWLCWPRFDSDACLSALLGTEEHGTWRIAPSGGPATVTRRYAGDDLVLQTEFVVSGRRLVLTDFMPVRRNGVSAVVRRLEALEGTVEVEVLLRLRFGYGEMPPWWEQHEDGVAGEVGPDKVVLRGPGLSLDGEAVRARLTLRAGERADYVLQHSRSQTGAPGAIDPTAAQEETERSWRDWIGTFDKATDWPAAVKRSLLTLRALTYLPTGGIVAAPTLGLPEKPGGTMNWDYRYCWLRDSTFTLTALLNAGFHAEAEAWQQWLFRAIAGAPDKMRIMYRVDGGRQIEERNGRAPARLEWRQACSRRQRGRRATSARRLWRGARQRPALPEGRHHRGPRRARRPESGWSTTWSGSGRSRTRACGKAAQPRRHYVYSKVMAWVAVDRVLALGDVDPARRGKLEALRDRIHADVCAKGYDDPPRELHAVLRLAAPGRERAAAAAGRLPARRRRAHRRHLRRDRERPDGGRLRPPAGGALVRQGGRRVPALHLLAGRRAGDGRAARRSAGRCSSASWGCPTTSACCRRSFTSRPADLVGNFPQALTHIAVVNTGLSLCGPTSATRRRLSRTHLKGTWYDQGSRHHRCRRRRRPRRGRGIRPAWLASRPAEPRPGTGWNTRPKA